MPRWIPILLVAGAALLRAGGPGTQDPKNQDPPPEKSQGELKRERPKAEPGKYAVPPEEDKSLVVEEYSFNPLQAEKDLQVGNYYFKKGSYRSAAGRFREATRWNEGNSEAWLRLGEAEEKLKDRQAAREAYSKYLEVAGDDAKNADEIRKKIGKLEKAQKR